MLNLDGLPDSMLVEILGHLPYESIVRCMCVSKRWYSLVFNPSFLSRCSRVRPQTDSQNPVTRTMMVTNRKNPSDFFSMSSEQPLGPIKIRNFSLSFLPCFQGPPPSPVVSSSTREYEPLPTVVATYNDLVLCCATMFSQRDYYICNPYTKQWDALPPAPQCRDLVKVGLICNPSNQGVLNDEYSYRVLRIIIPLPLVRGNISKQFKVQIFASETRTWTETVVSSPREFCVVSLISSRPAVGYDGMLYFGGSSGLIGLDLYSSNINATSTINCRFIDLPEDKANVMDLPEDDQVKFIDLPAHVYRFSDFVHLSAIKARTGRGFSMRMCELLMHCDRGNCNHDGVGVWEYFEDDQTQVGNAGKRWCLVDIVPLNWIRRQCPSIKDCSCKRKAHASNFTRPLGFDPYNEDILYLEFCQHIVMYNVSAKTLTEAWRTDLLSYGDAMPGGTVFPFVIPRRPTPVVGHKQRDEGSCSFHAAEKISVSAAAKATGNPISYPSVSTGSRSSSTRPGLEENVAKRKGGAKEHMSKRRFPAADSEASKKRKANEAGEASATVMRTTGARSASAGEEQKRWVAASRPRRR